MEPERLQRVVLDTNIVLDVLVFADPRVNSLKLALEQRRLGWLATREMRDELERVLAYPAIAAALARRNVGPAAVLREQNRLSECVSAAAVAPLACADPDDQKFLDLAVAWRATLLSKDRALLNLRKRLAALGVAVAPQWAP